jgi:hypothetical protein
MQMIGDAALDIVLYHAQSWAASPQRVWAHLSDIVPNRSCELLPRSALNEIPRHWCVSRYQFGETVNFLQSDFCRAR